MPKLSLVRSSSLGDSLVRHLSTSLLLLLSGNFDSGAMPVNASQSDRDKCHGEFQLTYRDCSIDISAHSIKDLPHNSICNGNFSFNVDCVQDYTRNIGKQAMDKVDETLGHNNSYLIVGVGLHYLLDSDSVIAQMRKLIEYIERKGNGWPNIIWVELHSLNGFLRMETKFHNDRIKKFNDKVNEFLGRRNVNVIKTFDISRDLKSYDGQHYGIGFNLHKLNMVLSFLQRKLQES